LLAPDFHHTRRVPKLTVDHIVPVGEVGGRDYIQKMWTPSKNLRAICPKCHYKKTREDAVSHLCMVHGEKCPEGCKRV
jgi:5-methylcytosine-specific restriction endonuclease McrA